MGKQTLSFEQFQATRRFVADLAIALIDATINPEQPGLIYAGDLFIETRATHWAADVRGNFFLALGADNWCTNDLPFLERMLYDHGISEGQLDLPIGLSPSDDCAHAGHGGAA